MMIAVIKTGGKQYKVSPGDRVRVERLSAKDGQTLEFKEVLLVSDEQGKALKIGTPSVSGVKVTAKVLANGRAKKIQVGKFKNKIRYFRHKGHRQLFTEIQIEAIV